MVGWLPSVRAAWDRLIERQKSNQEFSESMMRLTGGHDAKRVYSISGPWGVQSYTELGGSKGEIVSRDRHLKVLPSTSIFPWSFFILRGPIGTSKKGKMQIATSTSPLHPTDVILVQVWTSGIFHRGAGSREQGLFILSFFLITEI